MPTSDLYYEPNPKPIDWYIESEHWFKVGRPSDIIDTVSFIERLGRASWSKEGRELGTVPLSITNRISKRRRLSINKPAVGADSIADSIQTSRGNDFRDRWNKSLGMKHYHDEDSEAIDNPQMVLDRLTRIDLIKSRIQRPLNK